MEQEDGTPCSPPKEDDASEQPTTMDASCGGALEVGSKVNTATSAKQDDNVAVENGLPHDDSCKGNIEASQCKTDEVDSQNNQSSSSSNKATPVKITTCESCLSEEITENEISTSKEHETTERVQCDKCHKNITATGTPVSLENESNPETNAATLPNQEKCPMCDMTFESAELLDEHLLSPESCRKRAESVLSQNIAKNTEVTDTTENLSLFEENTSVAENNNQDIYEKQQSLKVESAEGDSEKQHSIEQFKLPEGVDVCLVEAGDVVEQVSSPKNDETIVDNDSVEEAKDIEDEQLSSPKNDDIIEDSVEGANNVEEYVSSPKNDENIVDSLEEVMDLEEQLSSPKMDEIVEDSVEGANNVEEHVSSPKNDKNVVDSLEEAMDVEEQLSSPKMNEIVEDSVEGANNVEEHMSSPKNEANVVNSCEAKDVQDQLSSPKNDDIIEDGVKEANDTEEHLSSPRSGENIEDTVGEAKDVEDRLSSANNDECIAEMSPILTCNEIHVEEPQMTDGVEKLTGNDETPVPVVSVPVTATVVIENDSESKEKASPSRLEAISYNVQVDGCQKSTDVATDAASPIKPTILQDANSKVSSESNQSNIIEIIDSDSESTCDKLPSHTKVNAKDETTVKLSPLPTTVSTNDNKTGGDDKTKANPLHIKKKFITGNETLDQDVVEILQDSTKSGGRVTRSMRKPTKVGPGEDKVTATESGIDGKSAQVKTVKCKLVTSPTPLGNPQIKVIPQTSSNSGSLLLQVPASSVQGGARFIVTIPESNSNQTPAGKYLITVPPTTDLVTGEESQAKTVLLKASSINTTSPTSDNSTIAITDELPTETRTTSTSAIQLVSKPSETDVESVVSSEEVLATQLKKTIMLTKQTRKVYVKELEEIDDVIFECPKCKVGFPHMLLVQLHMEDCCHHPPTQKPTVHMRIPTEVLLKFYEKQSSPNRQNYKCVCCQEVISFRKYRIGKYYPSLATHFAKHTSPAVKVINYTEHSKIKELNDVLTVQSKQAVEWIDHMVPPFTLGNQPVSSQQGTLDGYLCTSNKLHQESLLLLEYDSDELNEEMYLERRKKEKKKKKRRGRSGIDETGAYVCNWKAAIVKEDSNILEVTEIGTPKSAFPADIHKSGSLKHSILHSPSKVTPMGKKDPNQGKSSSKKKKNKSKTDAAKQLFIEDNINRRRSPRKGGTENVFLSLPQKKKRRERSLDTPNKTSKSKNASDDEIILLSSGDESQHSINSKETDVQNRNKKTNGPQTAATAKETTARGTLPRQESIDDDSSRSSLPSLPESATKNQDSFEALRSASNSRLPSASVNRAEDRDEDSRQSLETQSRENEERPPSRASSIICLSDSNDDDNEGHKGGEATKTQNKNLIQKSNTSTKIVMQKVAKNNAAQDNNKQKIPEISNSAKGERPSGAKGDIGKQRQAAADKVTEEVKKRKVPAPAVDDTEDVTVLSDIEEDEDDGVDLNSDNYDPILLDKHQVKTYFQMSREEPGIYECSLGGCTSCDCVAESDLFEHLCQHIHVEKVHPQKRSKTILFKGKVVPQYLKLTRHQIWAHFCNITLDSDMEICDEYMQQYKQCRWGNCGQRVWTKYGRLSHHLRSHLRFTQIDAKRYEKMWEARGISGTSNRNIYQPMFPQNILQNEARLRVSDGDQVICLPEDIILGKFKFGKSPSKNVRGIFNCLACEYSHHLDSNASAVLTVKILACHLKQHLPLSQSYTCLITPKALKSSLRPRDYAAGIRAHLPKVCRDLEGTEELPEVIVTSFYDIMKMKFIEAAVMGAIVPILNKDGVLYRCLYSGCQIGVVGEKRKALIQHIKEHASAIADTDVTGHNKDGSDSLPHLEDTAEELQVRDEKQKRKRKASTDGKEESNATATHSKHRKVSETGESSETRNVQGKDVEGTADMDDASSDGDIVELIEISSQDSSLNDRQPLENASQEDSQESIVTSAEGSSAMDITTGGSTIMDGNDRNDLPEWSTSNRGVNSVTGIEPSRDNPSRSMDDLRQNPNDVIVCSMPDVEAYFCEHIVKYSSYVSSLSDKVTFGKPSYSCPECRETGLKGVALKQHLESHIGKTIKWKSLTKNMLVPESESQTEQHSPRKFRTMTKLKRSSLNRVITPHKMKLSPRKWEGKNGLLRYNSKEHVRLVGQGVRRARQNFNSVLSRILNRERNLRRAKMTRSPMKRLSPYGSGYRIFRRSMKYGNTPTGNLRSDLSTRVKQGQSSTTKDAEIVKQSPADGDKQETKQGNHNDSCISKSNTSQTEVIDLVDEGTSDIISVGSDEMEMSNAMQKGQANQQMSVETEEPQGDDLFLTIDDILKEHFTKEEKQRSRKGIGMNFIVVQYKCRRCNFTTLTVLDVPEHVAFHIKRKVILKIKMDK